MRKLILIAVSFLLMVNIIVLAGVAYNRTDDKVAKLVLTERELSVVTNYSAANENSGVALTINWAVLNKVENTNNSSYQRKSPDWLHEAKLKSLGVDTDKIRVTGNPDTRAYEYSAYLKAIEVICVIEYDGVAYSEALEMLSNEIADLKEKLQASPDDKNGIKTLAKKNTQLTRMQIAATRLYVIDAGLDAQVLMAKYKDKTRYMIMRGEVRPLWNKGKISGRIERIFIPQIHVPLPYAQVVSRATHDREFSQYGELPIEPRYQVELNIGKRLEPWIDAVNAL